MIEEGTVSELRLSDQRFRLIVGLLSLLLIGTGVAFIHLPSAPIVVGALLWIDNTIWTLKSR